MGERLNMELVGNNNESLANCYFHRGAYTLSALRRTKEVIEYVNINNPEISRAGAVKILENIGASFNIEAFEEAKKMGIVSGEFPGCKGRNEGLIAVDKSNMKTTRDWEEGRITINLCAQEKNELMEYDDIWERINDLFHEIKDLENYQIYNIPFHAIDSFIKGVKEAEENYEGRFYFGKNVYFSTC